MHSKPSSVSIAPIIQGCEGEILSSGNEATLVGFGYFDNGDTSKDDVKHWVNVSINGPAQGNTEISVGGNTGKVSCPEDSGGPAFVQLGDGTWRTAGITSCGAGHGSCGYEPSCYTRAELAIELIESELASQGIDDIDLTPCFDGETWNPKSQCGGYALELDVAHGIWADACSEGAPKAGYSATCGEPFDDDDDDSTDEDDDSTDDEEDDSISEDDDASTSEDDDSDESTPTTEDSDSSDGDDEASEDDESSDDPTPSDSDDDDDKKTKNSGSDDDESGCQCRGSSPSPLWAGLFVTFTPWLIRRRRAQRK